MHPTYGKLKHNPCLLNNTELQAIKLCTVSVLTHSVGADRRSLFHLCQLCGEVSNRGSKLLYHSILQPHLLM